MERVISSASPVSGEIALKRVEDLTLHLGEYTPDLSSPPPASYLPLRRRPSYPFAIND